MFNWLTKMLSPKMRKTSIDLVLRNCDVDSLNKALPKPFVATYDNSTNRYRTTRIPVARPYLFIYAHVEKYDPILVWKLPPYGGDRPLEGSYYLKEGEPFKQYLDTAFQKIIEQYELRTAEEKRLKDVATTSATDYYLDILKRQSDERDDHSDQHEHRIQDTTNVSGGTP